MKHELNLNQWSTPDFTTAVTPDGNTINIPIDHLSEEALEGLINAFVDDIRRKHKMTKTTYRGGLGLLV